MLGAADRPTQVEDMIMPPQAHGVKVISIGMFTPGNAAVVWRGPMLHRALQQFLADVYWGDLDVLLLDLPPGTGDIAISIAQLVPTAEILVVTTPQTGRRRGGRAGRVDRAADPPAARRRGREHVLAGAARRRPHGGLRLRRRRRRSPTSLTTALGAPVPLLGQIPLDTAAARGRRRRHPDRADRPGRPAAEALRRIADRLAVRARGLAGRSLNITPAAAAPRSA